MAGQQGETKDETVVSLKTTGKNVKPRKKLERSKCPLVTFDLPYLAFYYNQKLMFYKGGDFEGMVAKLKDGLELVLEKFYQLAGKLGKDEEGVFRVEYDDDEADGVEVVEAAAEAVAVKDLAAGEGTGIFNFKDLIPYNGVHSLEGLHRPLLAIQLTKLKDGLAIGCAFNHAVLDGTSTWNFMNSWAEVCSRPPAVSARPFLDRTKSRNARVKPDLSPLPLDRSSLRQKLFCFSVSSIDKIKLAINASAPSDGFSDVEALSVHIWRHVTKARELKPEDRTVLTKFAECRNWISQSTPNFGNLTQAISTSATAAELLKEKPPKFYAKIIQNGIMEQKQQLQREPKIPLLKEPKAIEERNEQGGSQPKDAGKNCVTIEGSPRFKVYDVNFGWGPPEGVRSGSNYQFDGMVHLYQGKSGERSIDVEITLQAGVMEKLEMDREFLSLKSLKLGDTKMKKSSRKTSVLK